MKTLFYSIKGGQGKTTHAVWYAKHCGGVLITNDFDNSTSDIYGDVLGEQNIITLNPGDKVFWKVKKNTHIVYDFGGWVESRIIEAAKLVDVCVVPICYQSPADLMSGVKTIYTLQHHCKNIAILINNTDRAYISDLKKALEKRFPDFPIFIINSSKYISRLAYDGSTVFDLFAAGGLHKYLLRRVLPQVNDFYAYLDNYKNAWEK